MKHTISRAALAAVLVLGVASAAARPKHAPAGPTGTAPTRRRPAPPAARRDARPGPAPA